MSEKIIYIIEVFFSKYTIMAKFLKIYTFTKILKLFTIQIFKTFKIISFL